MFFIVVCTLLKPQMLLLALLFIIYRAYKYLAATAVVSVVLTLAGFLFFPAVCPTTSTTGCAWPRGTGRSRPSRALIRTTSGSDDRY